MAYRVNGYYWIKVPAGGYWEIGRYRETHSPGAPLDQRFEICGSVYPIPIDSVYKIGERVIRKEETDGV